MNTVNIQFGTAAQFGVGTARGGKNALLFVNSVNGKLNLLNPAGAIFHATVGGVEVLFTAGE